MNISPENPEIPDPKKNLSKPPSFEETLEALKTKLAKLPDKQRLPALPPSKEVLEEVQAYVKSLGLVVPSSPPPSIAVGSEFLSRDLLREGRTGRRNNFKVVSFIYKFSGRGLQAVIVHPRDGVDARLLGLAIFWGQVADVPCEIAQTEIVSIQEFFNICTFDLSGLIDTPALERFKSDYRREVQEEIKNLKERSVRAEASLDKLKDETIELAGERDFFKKDAINESNRAENWRLAFIFLMVALLIVGVWIWKHSS